MDRDHAKWLVVTIVQIDEGELALRVPKTDVEATGRFLFLGQVSSM
jgi:hypothetical protein